MKKLFLSLLISYSFSACAQSNYDSNVVVYDNVIEDEQVVQNTLVKHQKTINYYHVNETRENHYYLDNGLPHYYLHQRTNNYRKRPTTYREPYYSSPRQSKYRRAKPISTNYQRVQDKKWFFYFDIDSYSLINKEELGHLIDYAKTNRNAVFYIDSYADAQTGDDYYNMELSSMRANTITDILQREGISNNRLMVCPNGSSIQEYNTNNLNRCVIVKAVLK